MEILPRKRNFKKTALNEKSSEMRKKVDTDIGIDIDRFVGFWSINRLGIRMDIFRIRSLRGLSTECMEPENAGTLEKEQHLQLDNFLWGFLPCMFCLSLHLK